MSRRTHLGDAKAHTRRQQREQQLHPRAHVAAQPRAASADRAFMEARESVSGQHCARGDSGSPCRTARTELPASREAPGGEEGEAPNFENKQTKNKPSLNRRYNSKLLLLFFNWTFEVLRAPECVFRYNLQVSCSLRRFTISRQGRSEKSKKNNPGQSLSK